MELLLTNNPFPDYDFPIEDGGGITWNWIMETCRYYILKKELRQENKECHIFAREMEQKMFHNLRLFRSEQRFTIKLQKTNKKLFEQYLRTERKIDKLLHTDREKEIDKLKKKYSELSEKYSGLSYDFSLCHTKLNNQYNIIFDLEKKIGDWRSKKADLRSQHQTLMYF